VGKLGAWKSWCACNIPSVYRDSGLAGSGYASRMVREAPIRFGMSRLGCWDDGCWDDEYCNKWSLKMLLLHYLDPAPDQPLLSTMVQGLSLAYSK
jgi:hypothetical protein